MVVFGISLVSAALGCDSMRGELCTDPVGARRNPDPLYGPCRTFDLCCKCRDMVMGDVSVVMVYYSDFCLLYNSCTSHIQQSLVEVHDPRSNAILRKSSQSFEPCPRKDFYGHLKQPLHHVKHFRFDRKYGAFPSYRRRFRISRGTFRTGSQRC